MDTKIKIITRNWGKINPKKISDYLEIGGYQALDFFVKNPSFKKYLKEIEKSRLKGRGGAGFVTYEKIKQVFAEKSKEKYFICNFDESEPGTIKDRLIVENDPHLLLEGIILTSLMIGTDKAIIYINNHYKKAKEILEQALFQAKEKNFWGKNILDSNFNLDIEIFESAGAYICGEESALINSLSGYRGEPQIRPPYPTKRGYDKKPTLVLNVETIVNIPWILKFGGSKFSEIGSKKSPGTKLFTVSGSAQDANFFELPTGLTLRELIFENAQGTKRGKDFWFAQVGGASGRLFLEKELDTKLEYDEKSNFLLGTGSVLVVDRDASVWDLLFSWADFFARESCGKCLPCREGTFRMREIIMRFRDGEISQRDKQALKDILWTLENTSFCMLGKFAGLAIKDAVEKLKIFDD